MHGAALVISARLLRPPEADGVGDTEETKRIELLAMAGVMPHERQAGREPVNLGTLNRGWGRRRSA